MKPVDVKSNEYAEYVVYQNDKNVNIKQVII